MRREVFQTCREVSSMCREVFLTCQEVFTMRREVSSTCREVSGSHLRQQRLINFLRNFQIVECYEHGVLFFCCHNFNYLLISGLFLLQSLPCV
jgi:hypothetical protein